MKTLIAVVLTLAVVAALSAVTVYSGAISFAADEPHSAAVFELIETARERFVQTRSDGIEVGALDDDSLVAEGAEHYGAMCEGCHLAPGVDDTDLRRGLYPQPPKLASREYADTHGDPQAAARQFWIVKHGLKASAMPAWGVTHDDDAIRGVVAFLRKLPELSPAEYEALTAGARASHEHEEESQPERDAASGPHEHEPDTSATPGGSPREAVEAFLTALSTGRAQDAQRWLAPDVLIYESGGVEYSREQYAAQHLRADMEFLAQARVQRLEQIAHGTGDVAWIASRSRMHGEIDGKPLDLITTETMVLTREPEGWRIRHIHWSSARSDEQMG